MNKTPAAASLSAEAYLILRERILRGELPIGQIVSRRKIAEELGMSMLPVAEALRRLELEGLLESRPRAGTRVKIPTEAEVRGHYVVREALEVQAAKLFAEVAAPAERAALLKLATRVDALSAKASQQKGDRFLYLSLHEKLHRRIAEGTHCAPLCDAIEKNQVLASTWLCVPNHDLTQQAPRRHHALAEVLCHGKPTAAAEAMQKHVQNALNNTLTRLATYFELRESTPAVFSRSPQHRA